jgi:hypothetical protein
MTRTGRANLAGKRSPHEQINHARKLIDKGEAPEYVADLLKHGPLDTLSGAVVIGAAV